MQLSLKQLALLILIASSGIADAHQDTPLKLKDGKIVGLPAKYLPASFDLKKLSLSIGGKTLVFPNVLRELLMYDASDESFGESPQMKPHPYTYKFTSSWYHLNEGLPPYISVSIKLKNTDTYIKLLIDMDRLKFIHADIQIKHIGLVPIDLDGIPDNSKKKSN